MAKFPKYILVNLLTNEETQYKTLKEIAQDLNIEYFIIQCLYNHCKKNKKFLHNFNKLLAEKYKIVDIIREI
jgi:hypothetical protein